MLPCRSRFAPAPHLPWLALLALTMISVPAAAQQTDGGAPAATNDLDITAAHVEILHELELAVFEISVEGRAGHTIPEAAGQLDGAPVLGYVFPTTLKPEDVGFAPGDGIVALAATSHPDFDDTPLWDEGANGVYDDDGRIFHSHWVVLVPDDRVAGGLSVKATQNVESDLPPTAPGMPMYLDSPGFQVVLRDGLLKIIVPLFRMSNRTDFQFDAVSAYMRVNTSQPDAPMLGVFKVYSVLSSDLSLPYTVDQ